ncbi:hypothetical protein BDZ45DRAFT_410629 [Acephala macrosclerotiorum]|nr:hypothetical protein BDZ45DRAFT_410629 [Acephala macrosclerotiorum]
MAGLFRKFAKPFKLENRKEAKAHSSAQPVPNASHSKQPAAERPATAPTHLQVERELLWKKAYEALRKEKPQLVANLETIIKNDANLPEKTDIFSSEGIAAVSLSQKKRMEDKQWTYAWFNKPHKIRDTLEGILGAVSKATPLVSAGMNLAPSFVSLPWTFISLTIPFIMSDFSQMEGAISGLQEVTCILGSYNLVEQEFLLNPVVRDEFKSTVLDLYTKIFEYQASVAQYFAASTLKRLGRNIFSGTPWEDALAGVKKAESLCHRPVDALSVRLHQVSFKTLEDLVREQSISLNRAIEEVTARRKQHRDIMEWISPINPFQDHAELCGRLGDAYLGSGRWLFEDERFTSWHQSSSGFLLLQGVVGTGKSSLISIAIEHLMTRSDGRLAFFYCSENSSSQVSVNAAPSTSITIRNDTTNIFRSILAQCSILLDGSIADPIYEAFKRSSRQAAGESDLSLEATLKLLQDVLRVRDDQITLVFDALDELADYDSFLDNLTTLYGIGEKIRVLVSSRPSIDVPAEVPTLCVETISIQSQTAMDIKDYIEREVTQRSLKSKLDPTHAERLKKALVTFSEGV